MPPTACAAGAAAGDAPTALRPVAVRCQPARRQRRAICSRSCARAARTRRRWRIPPRTIARELDAARRRFPRSAGEAAARRRAAGGGARALGNGAGGDLATDRPYAANCRSGTTTPRVGAQGQPAHVDALRGLFLDELPAQRQRDRRGAGATATSRAARASLHGCAPVAASSARRGWREAVRALEARCRVSADRRCSLRRGARSRPARSPA